MRTADGVSLRPLISLLRSGASARRALIEWPETSGFDATEGITRCSDAARLGAPLVRCVQELDGDLGEDASAIGCAFELHRETGADLSYLLDLIEEKRIRDRAGEADAGARAAGMRTSARVVVALPLATIPLGSASAGFFLTPAGGLCLISGLVLAALGFTWVNKLLPSGSTSPGAPWVLRLIASSLRAGVELPHVMRVLARHDETIRGVYESVRDGETTWRSALGTVENQELLPLSLALERNVRLGLPLADTLDAEAQAAERAAAVRFEAALQRAVVKMALPLVLCILPSFVILGLVPPLLAT